MTSRFKNWTTENVKNNRIHISNGMGKKVPFVPENKKRAVKLNLKSTEKMFIYSVLLEKFGDKLELEFKGIPGRKFRFDYCVPSLSLAIEYEGTMSAKSRHTTISGYSKDSEKYNLCTLHGWKLLRYTALTYKGIIEDIEQFLKRK